VPVLDDDTADALAARILKQEHQVYPQAVRWFVEDRLQIEGLHVRVLNHAIAEHAALRVPEGAQ